MINDGYGEQMPLDQYEELILRKERLIRIQAAERTAGDRQSANDWDDLLQEARITLWEVAKAKPEKPDAYFHASTAKRIVEVLVRGVWTGMEGRRGVPRDPLRQVDRDSLDDPLLAIEVTAPEVLDALLMAYHEGEISQAIAALPPRHRLYVTLRFWYGFTNVEAAPYLGIKSGNVARMWNDSIAPVLRDRLAHLAAA